MGWIIRFVVNLKSKGRKVAAVTLKPSTGGDANLPTLRPSDGAQEAVWEQGTGRAGEAQRRCATAESRRPVVCRIDVTPTEDGPYW
ncbi:hypothetical protein U1Q18_016820 [Sarracenia purpurea var. burkii]